MIKMIQMIQINYTTITLKNPLANTEMNTLLYSYFSMDLHNVVWFLTIIGIVIMLLGLFTEPSSSTSQTPVDTREEQKARMDKLSERAAWYKHRFGKRKDNNVNPDIRFAHIEKGSEIMEDLTGELEFAKKKNSIFFYDAKDRTGETLEGILCHKSRGKSWMFNVDGVSTRGIIIARFTPGSIPGTARYPLKTHFLTMYGGHVVPSPASKFPVVYPITPETSPYPTVVQPIESVNQPLHVYIASHSKPYVMYADFRTSNPVVTRRVNINVNPNNCADAGTSTADLSSFVSRASTSGNSGNNPTI